MYLESQTDRNLGFPVLNSELLPAITLSALNFIATQPHLDAQVFRGMVHDELDNSDGIEGNSDYWWGPATAVCLQPVIISAFLDAHATHSLDQAFAANQQMYLDSIAAGAVIDNPWVTNDDPAREQVLDLIIHVIAESNHGDPYVYGNRDGVWSIADVPVTVMGYTADLCNGL